MRLSANRFRYARLPRLDMAYKVPPHGSGYALSVLATVLSGGRSSRLYESIVRQQLSSGVGARATSGLVQQRTSPGFRAAERYSRTLYGDHPAGRATVTAAGLGAITRDAMVEFHRTHDVPDHALIAFAGDISLAEARRKVETELAAWKKAGPRSRH